MIEFNVPRVSVQPVAVLADRLQDFREPLQESGAYLESKAKERSNKEVDPSGNPWKPLRPATIAAKRSRGAPLQILRDSGILVASIAFILSRNQVRVGPSVEYAIWHQTGTRRMPQRRIMGFESGDADAITRFFVMHLRG